MRKLIALSLIAVTVMAASTAQANAKSQYIATRAAVCHYFGRYCGQAMRVVACETGRTYSPWAHNGQYLGIFQMGSHERATYGHGNNVWAQAAAAWRYFKASGRDWSPWQCKPW